MMLRVGVEGLGGHLSKASARLAPARRWLVTHFRGLGATLAPAAVAIAILPFFYPLYRMALAEPLWGDTGVFQYTGWAIRHGMKLYRDVGMADGPFIHYFHAVAQMFVGTSDEGFRRFTCVFLGGVGMAIGALLAPRSPRPLGTRIAAHVGWAAIGLCVWCTWYFALDWMLTCEREVYYAAVGSLGMVLLYVRLGDDARRANVVTAFLGGLLVTSQFFGKPTGLAYVGLGALGLVLDRDGAKEVRWLRLKAASAGLAACVVVVVILLLFTGSIPGYFFWCFKVPFVGNRFLYAHDPLPYLVSMFEDQRRAALLSLGLGAAAIGTRLLPWRAAGLVLTPMALYLGSVMQARGYTYQFIPGTVASYLLLVVLLARLWEGSERPRWAAQQRTGAALCLAFVGYIAFDTTIHSPFRWTGDAKTWSVQKTQHYAEASKQLGDWLRDHTRAQDTVFAYDEGSNNMHFTLLSAQRKTASPFFYTFWLDPVGLLPGSEIKPNERELAALERLQAETRARACDAIKRNDPAAITTDRLEKIVQMCPDLQDMIATRYEERTKIGTFRVFLRK